MDPNLDAILLRRRRVVPIPVGEAPRSSRLVQALGMDLARLGYVPSTRLAHRLETIPAENLTTLRTWLLDRLAEELGDDRDHLPLFRKFPEDVPEDTGELWARKVLVHFLQAPGRPCLSCLKEGTTHVLSPCRHVVCDFCFDGANVSACPVCEHHVDTDSPFFQPDPESIFRVPDERVTLKVLDLAEDPDAMVGELFDGFVNRTQAMSPTDRNDLTTLVTSLGERCLPWIPDRIPVRENQALILGALFTRLPPSTVLDVARAHLKTATDVLRLLASISGADVSLQGHTVYRKQIIETPAAEVIQKLAHLVGRQAGPTRTEVIRPVRVMRFPMARLARSLRRALLDVLEEIPEESLIEDMLRHRSYWVWVGEFLHPAEYARRFPRVAKAFAIVRKKDPDGVRAPRFRSFASRVESLVEDRRTLKAIRLLARRPGELARRLDHLLREALPADREEVLREFTAGVEALSTPMLITLRHHFPGRTHHAPVRIYWPAGQVTTGVRDDDHRVLLDRETIDAVVRIVERELIRRFRDLGVFESALIDPRLGNILAPFNERTASPAALNLPRGSRIAFDPGKTTRLFLHWCEPAEGGHATDLDLSVAFYDETWSYLGVCSYYELTCKNPKGKTLATSSGDLRNAPHPDGATEFVDIHVPHARAGGVRYAVMVVNSYAGLPFDRLEHAFAGLMSRDDPGGAHFDPRTVELRFALQGANGVFLPLVMDLVDHRIHWLDVYAKGMFIMNNVETSREAIQTICPDLMTYFSSGVRASVFDLALLHAAARCGQVHLLGTGVFERTSGEDGHRFLDRIRRGEGATPCDASTPLRPEPVLAALLHADRDLPAGSRAYALFDHRGISNYTPSDLIT